MSISIFQLEANFTDLFCVPQFHTAECQSDNDCPYDKACYNEKCLNPCTYDTAQCGREAECFAQNHRANCACPAGTQGNPFVSCITGVCQYNEDCRDDEICDRLNRVCQPVCDAESCAPTALCRGKQHQPMCNCPPGTNGNPYIQCSTYREPAQREPECMVDADCPSQLACFSERCENPCSKSNVCTPEQTCSVLDTLPLRTLICKCPIDMYTDTSGHCVPIKQDQPGCRADHDCGDPEKCIRATCTLACRVDHCGINAQCLSTGHRSICSCAPGYEGNPHIECSPMPKTPTNIPVVECYNNDDCTTDRSCLNGACINPCSSDSPCGRGAFCHTNDHQPICTCPIGYTGSPLIRCLPPAESTVGCKSNSECTLSESCVNELCVNPCNCGPDAECHVNNHHPVCFCKPGYSGNAQFGCHKIGCQSDGDCPNDKQCINTECMNPCLMGSPCAVTAECYGHNHRASCKCPSGLEGNPLERCQRVECHSDYDCPGDRACLDNHCINPCATNYNPPCAQNALCAVRNHAAYCKCPDHLPDGNPLSYCEKRQAEELPECQMDYDCPTKMACIRNICVNPCRELTPCAKSASCSVVDSSPVRTMICECPELYVPDQNGECRRVVLPTPPAGCQQDSECPDNESCINRQCRNPCNCGIHALCSVKNHRATCSCETGYEGNPNSVCRTVGCQINSECDSGKSCVNGQCISPCIVNNPCGINAECYVNDNKAECRCLSGYRGNPWDVCNVVGCRTNSDCPSDKACENSQCVNPCVYEKSCSPRAECKAQNHVAICRCPSGFNGNPYTSCTPEPQPECKFDTDCSPRLACINHKCVNPCTALEPCQRPSRCEVVPSAPVRTMICVCPEGYVSSGSGTCKPLQPVQDIGGCVSDSDCPSNKACINDICRNPCNCGTNAECRVKNHKPVCSCEQGYDGNAEIQCVRIGCRSDSECSGTHACINRECVPACTSDRSICGERAICNGINHKALCQCPSGFSGNPYTACVLLGCRSDAECPTTKACINNKCDNPCEKTVCGRNEICQVYDHRAECSCPPGYVGDSIKGCNQFDEVCRLDSDCASQTACIRSECVNPCTATQPCGVNAECKVLDTVPVRTMVCECLPGYQGNAAIQCDKRKSPHRIIFILVLLKPTFLLYNV